MAVTDDIPSSVHALFPKTAARKKYIDTAFHPARAKSDPPADHADGWESVHELATSAALRKLRSKGYTRVSISADRSGQPFRESTIDALIP